MKKLLAIIALGCFAYASQPFCKETKITEVTSIYSCSYADIEVTFSMKQGERDMQKPARLKVLATKPSDSKDNK